jgi:hypothetical protein
VKTLDVQARLEYARAAVAVLRALRIADRTMRYGEFAAAIGLGDKWQPWHRQQIADILNLVAAAERQAGDKTEVEPLQFERIVTGQGKPGKGIKKASKIVRTAPQISN